ncbi:hypothetical protein E8E13_004974 [Curvularia kusanoi]|uniref:BTB domain-containing protein n=1 Tax=Curvularia kusanoi TaxID=90978 RepID=A0A9P4TM51_CURKU|nr:hypothetical protein E8E13_004974 [Curvularia kusanoi]
MAVHQASPAFYKELWESGVLSDIELQISKSKSIKAHSKILGSKSSWFQENCEGNNIIRLRNLPEATKEHFRFDLVTENRNEEALFAMVAFCYTGPDSLPKHLDYPGTPVEIQECNLLFHLDLNMLARQYGIPSLVAYSFEKIKDVGRKLRGKPSDLFAATLVAIGSHHMIDMIDPLTGFALDELQYITDNQDGKVVNRDWFCKSCRTAFQVRYLPQRGTTGKDFSLNECPNCANNADDRDENMEDDDEE